MKQGDGGFGGDSDKPRTARIAVVQTVRGKAFVSVADRIFLSAKRHDEDDMHPHFAHDEDPKIERGLLEMKNRSDRINRPGNIDFAAAGSYPTPNCPHFELKLLDQTLQTYSHPMLRALGEIVEVRVGGIPWQRVYGPEPTAGQYVVEVVLGERWVRLGSPPIGGVVTVWGKETD